MKHVPCVCKVWSLCLMGELLSVMASAASIAGAPDCYLDYIESTGSQYIDTGVNAETGLKARIDMEWGAIVKPLADGGGDDWSMLDARKDGGNTRFYLCHLAKNTAATSFIFGYGYNTWHRTATEAVRGSRCEVLADFSNPGALSIRMNGAEMLDNGQRSGHANETINLSLNLYLFACNYNKTAYYFARGKLYECKIFKKNSATGEMELLRHFLPARKNGHVGLYDKANDVFYYDADNEFVAGDVLDKPLALVESLTSDGTNDTYQCFNTWVYGKSGLRSEVDFSPLYPTGDRGILACRETSGDTRFFMAYHYQTAFRFSTGKLLAKSDINVVAPQTGVRYVIRTDTTPGAQSMTVSANGGEAVEVLKDGVDYGSDYMATTNTLSLLATHRAYDNNFATPAEGTLYATKIWDGDELLRDFVPAVATNSAGALYAGLYDKVTGRIYKPLKGKISSERDCPFDLESEVGPVTNVLVTVDPPKTRLEYLDSDGTADYVNLGVVAKDGLEMDAVMEWLTVPDDDVFVGARPTSGNTRFFLYNAWPAHSIGYAKDLPRIADGGENTFFTPVANVKYKVSSRLDDGDQFLAVAADANGVWTALGRTDRTYAGPMDTELPLYLFARNYIGKADSFAHARVYSLKLRAKQPSGAYAPALNLVPVRDPLTGGAALWDKVGERYYRSGGSFRLAGGGAERPLTPGFLVILR